MTALALFLGILLPWLTGLGFMLALPTGFGSGSRLRTWPWTILCALVLGLAMHVLLASLLLIVSPGWMHPAQVFVPEVLLSAFMLYIGIGQFRARKVAANLAPARRPVDVVVEIRYTAGALASIAFLAGIWMLSTKLFSDGQVMPEGYFDAWHIWNFKARIIAQGQEQWRWYLLAPEAVFSHQEYPIGFNVLLARLFLANGEFDPFLTKCVGLGTALLSPLLVWAAALRAKGLIHAGCAGLLTLAFPFAFIQPAWQYADAPLGVLLLTAIGWHYFYCRSDRPFDLQARLAWAGYGLLLGSLLWTKNEGLVMAGSLVGLTFLFDFIRISGIKPLAFSGSDFTAGLVRLHQHQVRFFSRYAALALPLAILAALHIYIKLSAPEATDLIKDHTIDKQFQGLIDFNRVKIILAFFGDSFINLIDRYSMLLALAGLVLLGLDHRKSRLWPPAIYTLSLLTVSLAYGVTFLFTPYDLNWHLGTAMSRLMIQLWPAAVFIYVLWTYPMDRAVMNVRWKV